MMALPSGSKTRKEKELENFYKIYPLRRPATQSLDNFNPLHPRVVFMGNKMVISVGDNEPVVAI